MFGGKAGSGDKQLCTRYRASWPVHRGQGAVGQDDDFDAEPLVAPWHGSQESLDQGILHYAPELTGVPLGPALMHRWGELVRPVLFRRSATDR